MLGTSNLSAGEKIWRHMLLPYVYPVLYYKPVQMTPLSGQPIKPLSLN